MGALGNKFSWAKGKGLMGNRFVSGGIAEEARDKGGKGCLKMYARSLPDWLVLRTPPGESHKEQTTLDPTRMEEASSLGKHGKQGL